MNLRNDIAFVVMLVVIFCSGSHLLDVGDLLLDDNATATNGFFDIHPMKVYHIGYYAMYISFIVLIIAYISLLASKKCGGKNGLV